MQKTATPTSSIRKASAGALSAAASSAKVNAGGYGTSKSNDQNLWMVHGRVT